jgi:ParB family chromosome partitioning protein
MVIEDLISAGHARALLGIEDEEAQYELAVKILDEKLSVRDIENIIQKMKNPKQKKEKQPVENAFIYKDLEEKMIALMGTKVSVNHKAKGKGKIEIEYYSNEELERIFDLLMSISQNQ